MRIGSSTVLLTFALIVSIGYNITFNSSKKMKMDEMSVKIDSMSKQLDSYEALNMLLYIDNEHYQLILDNIDSGIVEKASQDIE